MSLNTFIYYPIHPNAFRTMDLNIIVLNPLPEMLDNPYFKRNEHREIKIVDIRNLAIDARISVKFAIRKMMEMGA